MEANEGAGLLLSLLVQNQKNFAGRIQHLDNIEWSQLQRISPMLTSKQHQIVDKIKDNSGSQENPGISQLNSPTFTSLQFGGQLTFRQLQEVVHQIQP